MKKVIQVRIFRGERFYVAEGLDLPVVTQATTLDELADNLREAIALQLEGEDPADFDLEPNPAVIVTFELDTVAGAKA